MMRRKGWAGKKGRDGRKEGREGRKGGREERREGRRATYLEHPLLACSCFEQVIEAMTLGVHESLLFLVVRAVFFKGGA